MAVEFRRVCLVLANKLSQLRNFIGIPELEATFALGDGGPSALRDKLEDLGELRLKETDERATVRDPTVFPRCRAEFWICPLH